MLAPIGKDHLLFSVGVCWLLRNLAYQDPDYNEFGDLAMSCLDILWPDLEKHMQKGEKG